MSDTVLDIRQLSVYYRTLRGYVKALDDLSLQVMRGEIIGVAGESGCGKTTLAYSLIMRKPPMYHMGGDAQLLGKSLMRSTSRQMRSLRYRNISIIPQAAMNSFSPTKKIRTFVGDLVSQHRIRPDAEFFEKVRTRFVLVNLDPSVLDAYPIELSGGMKQRVVMVLSTLLDPDVLIADEITSALDVTSQRFVSRMLWEFRQRRIVGSIIFITHDLAISYQLADRIAVMYAGHLAECAPADTVVHAPRHPYTMALIASLPRMGTRFRRQKLHGIEGVPPKLLEIGEGCRFRWRCPYAAGVCARKTPQIEEAGEGHILACHRWREIQEEQR